MASETRQECVKDASRVLKRGMNEERAKPAGVLVRETFCRETFGSRNATPNDVGKTSSLLGSCPDTVASKVIGECGQGFVAGTIGPNPEGCTVAGGGRQERHVVGCTVENAVVHAGSERANRQAGLGLVGRLSGRPSVAARIAVRMRNSNFARTLRNRHRRTESGEDGAASSGRSLAQCTKNPKARDNFRCRSRLRFPARVVRRSVRCSPTRTVC